MESVKKIQKIGKILRIAALVLSILMFVGAGFMLFGALILALVPESWLSVSGQLSGRVEIGSTLGLWRKIVGELAEELPGGQVDFQGNSLVWTFDSPQVKIGITKLCALGAFFCAFQAALYAVVFLFVSKFGKVLQKNSSPFSRPCIRYLKATAFVLLAWALLGGFTDSAVQALLLGRFAFGFSLNFGTILIALILLLIAYIFEYGAKLQRESDETL